MFGFDYLPVFFRELNLVSMGIRFLLAILCGGIIGLERGSKRHAAGFRTHILVCIGACMAMMTGQYIYQVLGASNDPARMGAQVISGIGFLGVGTIIITKSNKVKGLTTAAGLWSAACIGLALGIGFYEAALLGTFSVILAVVVMHKIDEIYYSRAPILEVYVELESINYVRMLLINIKENNMKISSMEVQKPQSGANGVGVILTIKKCHPRDSIDMMEILSCTEGVMFVEEIT